MAIRQELEQDQTIIETWTIQDLEDYKWELMLNNRPWEAVAIQVQIDDILIDIAANWVTQLNEEE